MQKLKLTMSIVLGEKLNSWQSPNVLRRQHYHSKLVCGHTYKLVLKYLKLTAYRRFVAFFLSLSYPTRTKNKIKLSRQQKIFCNFPFYFQMFSFSFRQQTLDTIYLRLMSCSQYDEKILPYQVSFDVKEKLFNFCSYDSLEQLTILLWWWQLVSNNEVNKIIN